MTVLVVGATGMVGLETCRQLAPASHRVRALVRATSGADKRAELAGLGAELVEGDLKSPASLDRACAGVEAVISTASSTLSRADGDSIKTVDEDGQLALVDAAARAGVRHFVFVSYRDNPSIQYPLTIAKRAVERRLTASGMAYTILQASYFMEVWLSPALGFDAANRRVRLYGSGESPTSWISYKDVARVAAAAVDQPAARNLVLDVGGPDALSVRQIIGMFEAAGSGAIATEHVGESDLRAQLAAAADPIQKSFAGLMLQCAAGDAMDVSATRRLFPFRMTSVADFVAAQTSRT